MFFTSHAREEDSHIHGANLSTCAATFTCQATVRKWAAATCFLRSLRGRTARTFRHRAHTPDPFPFELGRLGKQKGTDQWMCFFGKHVHEHDDLILVG